MTYGATSAYNDPQTMLAMPEGRTVVPVLWILDCRSHFKGISIDSSTVEPSCINVSIL